MDTHGVTFIVINCGTASHVWYIFSTFIMIIISLFFIDKIVWFGCIEYTLLLKSQEKLYKLRFRKRIKIKKMFGALNDERIWAYVCYGDSAGFNSRRFHCAHLVCSSRQYLFCRMDHLYFSCHVEYRGMNKNLYVKIKEGK